MTGWETRAGKCPYCGSERVARIICDAPAFSRRLEEAIEAGKDALGGSCSTDNSPRWRCIRCGYEWGHPRGSAGSSAGEADLA